MHRRTETKKGKAAGGHSLYGSVLFILGLIKSYYKQLQAYKTNKHENTTNLQNKRRNSLAVLFYTSIY